MSKASSRSASPETLTLSFPEPVSPQVRALLAQAMEQHLDEHRTLRAHAQEPEPEDLDRLMREVPRRTL